MNQKTIEERHPLFKELYSRVNDLIYVGNCSTFRLLTDFYKDDVPYTIQNMYGELLNSYPDLKDIPFAEEFNFNDNDKVLLISPENYITFIDRNKDNSYKTICNSIEQLLEKHQVDEVPFNHDINHVKSMGHKYQIITSDITIEDILPSDRYIELDENGYYTIDDYKELILKIFLLDRESKDIYSVKINTSKTESDIKHEIILLKNNKTDNFDLKESEEPNTFNSDDGFLSYDFIKKLTNYFAINKSENSFFIFTETPKAFAQHKEYFVFINQAEFEQLIKCSFRFRF